MSRLNTVRTQKARRQNRTRKSLTTDSKRPRLTVTISNLHVVAQIIDDTKHTTLVSSTSTASKAPKGTKTEKAAWVGEDIATKAKAKKIKKVAFDRGNKAYHGRIKALADAARKGGLEF